MSLVKRCKTWHCHFVVKGQRFRQSLGTKDWREAQSEEKRLIADASKGKLTHHSTTLSIRKSKTAAGERVVPLTDVSVSALARLRRRAEAFGAVEPSHYVFAAFVPKFTFSGKRVIDYNVTALIRRGT